MAGNNLWNIILAGGFIMYPLVLCSIVVWAVILERLWNYRKLGNGLRAFHLEAANAILRHSGGGIPDSLKALCQKHLDLPTATLLQVAVDRLGARDERLRKGWAEALERRRQLMNQELRRNLWVLGTIGSAAPFIGLFGTVVGILHSFQDIAQTNQGGFAVVASGISSALVATAAGIVVAVVAVMAFNAFQTRWSSLVLTVKVHTEELAEMLSETVGAGSPRGD